MSIYINNISICKAVMYDSILSLVTKVKKEFNPPLVILTDKDLAWIAEKLTEVDSLYTHFGLSLAEWTVIEKNNPRDYANVKRDTLLCWRRKQGYNATLANLVSVLAEPENYDAKLIEEIIQHFNRKCKCVDILYKGVWLCVQQQLYYFTILLYIMKIDTNQCFTI